MCLIDEILAFLNCDSKSRSVIICLLCVFFIFGCDRPSEKIRLRNSDNPSSGGVPLLPETGEQQGGNEGQDPLISGQEIAGMITNTSTGGTSVTITEGELGCDIQEALTAYNCQSAGCHAAPTRSNFRIEGSDFESHMINAQATYPGCEDRKIIDSLNPDQSLLLQSVGAELPPLGTEDTCQLVMPPSGGEVSATHQSCFRRWVHAIAASEGPLEEADFEAASIPSAVRKVKTLLTGGTPSVDEIARVSNNPETLRALVDTWITSEAGEEKLIRFFELSLQQRSLPAGRSQFDKFRSGRPYRDKMTRVMNESFARTALHLMQTGQPFNQIATTRQWMVTTANLVLLLYPDQSRAQRSQNHLATPVIDDAPRRLARQVSQRKWYIPSLEVECRFDQTEALSMLFGRIRKGNCRGTNRTQVFDDSPLSDEDFSDWRLVTFNRRGNLSDEEQIPFYDIPRLRNAVEIDTRLHRVGFFTTSVFMQNWATNVDNQFRVLTNQTLITSLHLTFSPTEPTDPPSSDGLDEDHANQPDCVGCHRQLDPMRLYFAQSFNVNGQLARGNGEDGLLFPAQLVPSFGFYRQTGEGGGLGALATTIANHPNFASAWVQKLCLYANSQKCQSDDPEVLRLAQSFKDSNFNFKSLLVDFFSSPLVTHLSETGADQVKEPIISITRRDHLCALLSERTAQTNLCEDRRVQKLLELIPEDGFARGSADFVQPSLPSAFHFSAAESLCETVATLVVNAESELFSSNRAQQSLSNLVSRLMGISEMNSRYLPTVSALGSLYDRSLNAGQSSLDSMRSTFSLACLSPDVMGVGL